MALTTKLNLINAKFCQDTGGVLDLSGTTNIGEAKYLTDKSGDYTARSIVDAEYVTGLTNNIDTELQSQIDYLSGETDLRLLISDFDSYTGDTQTTLSGLRSDIDTVSGQTDTNTSDIDNLGALSAITEVSITGVTNGLTKDGSHDAKLGGTLIENTEIKIPSTRYVWFSGQTVGGRCSAIFQNGTGDVQLYSCQSTSGCARLNLNISGEISLGHGDGSSTVSLIGRNGGFDIVDSGTIGSKCLLQYNDDYTSSMINPRQIPDIGFVTGQTGAIGATNGLTREGDNVVLGGTLTGNTDIDVSTFDLTFTSDSIQYGGDYSGTYVARSIVDAAYVTGLTDNIETSLQSQIDYVSGQTDLKLAISDFNSYSASTDTRLDTIEGDLDTVSGQTDTNTSDIATNASDIDELSGLTINSVTGATNGLSLISGSREVKLGGALTGDTTISGSDFLEITAPFGACCASFIDLTPDAANLPAVPDEGMLYYSACTLNFVRDFPNVVLQVGEEQVVRVQNNTGGALNNGEVVYINGADGDMPTVDKAIASNDTQSRRSIGVVTHNIPNGTEGFVTTGGIVRGINTGAWSVGDPVYLSTSTAGLLTTTKPPQDGNNIVRVGFVTVVDTSDGEIFIDMCCENEYTFNNDFTGYTASTESRLSGIETDIDTVSGQTDTNTSDIADLTDITDIAITGVTNGLTKVGDNDARLGGALTQATTISGAYDLTLSPSSDFVMRTVGEQQMLIDGQSSSGVVIRSQSGTLTNKTSLTDAIGIQMDFNAASGFAIYDNRSTQKGIEYAADYSDDYTNRSLVDKSYVDSIASGQQTKSSVQVATTSTDGDIDVTGGTFSSGSTIDSHVVLDGERVLVKNQNDASENGIWVFSGSSDIFYRADDYDFTPTGEIANGDIIPVVTGNTNANTQWALTSPDPVAEGDDLNFTLFSKLLEIDEGDGIVFANVGGATQINVDLATNSGLDFNAGDLTVATEIAGSGLTFSTGVLDVNASATPATGSEIDVRFDGANNLVVDADDFQTITASNGITLNAGDVAVLGGTLTGDTSIDGDSGAYDLSFNSLDSFNLGFSNTSTITDNQGTKTGLVYAADYKATFVDNSLVSKAYVDCQVTSGVLADNGLTKVDDTVILGGTLTGDTCILHGSGAFYMCDNGGLASVELDASNATVYVCDQGACMSAGDGSCTGSVGITSSGSINICSDNATTGVSVVAPAQGVVYGGDYEANFVDRSLVTKQYVDDQISTSAVTAGVGLTNNANAFDVNITDTTVAGNELNVKIDTVGTDVLYIDSADITNDNLVAAGGNTINGTEITLKYNGSDELVVDSDDIENIFGEPITGATNGLGTDGKDVCLGGTLTKDTSINTADAYGLAIGNGACATGNNAIAIGEYACAIGDNSFAGGEAGSGGYGSYSLQAVGCNSFIFSEVGLNTDSFVCSQNSAILGGQGHRIDATNNAYTAIIGGLNNCFADNNACAVILGGYEIEVGDGALPNHAIVPSLAIWDTPADDSDGDILVWDSSTKKVGKTTLSTIGGVTGGTNGLGVTGNDVCLGGTLDNETTINGAQTLNFNISAFNVTGATDFNSAVSMGSTLEVTGAVDANSGLNVAGAGEFQTTLDVTGATTLGSTLEVTGAVDLSSTLGVTGATTLGSTLDVGGTVTLDSVATGSNTDDVLTITAGGEIQSISASELGEDNNTYSVTGVSNSTINLVGSEYVVLVDTTSGPVTVNLPASPATGAAVKIKDKGNGLTNNVTISGNGNNIDGSGSATINTDYGALELVYDGTDWFALAFVN